MNISTEKLSENMEDYLEVIYALSKNNGVARVSQIAAEMSVKSPTVNVALKSLADKHLVLHEKYGYVTLTSEGEKLAAAVQDKHDILFRFLTEFLMIDPKLADNEACSIEHAISEETYRRLVKFFEFIESSVTDTKPKMLQNFEIFLKTGKRRQCGCQKK